MNDQTTTLLPEKITPKMERPSSLGRVRTGVRAGEGGVTHTDNWRDISRR